MKTMKKLLALALVLIMVTALSITAFAQSEALNPADADDASITISNPAKGETYSLFKVFDALIGDTLVNGKYPITYTYSSTTLPDSLASVFDINTETKIVSKKSTATDAAVLAAVESWVNAESNAPTALISAVSDGSDPLVFSGLPYGYYIMTTTHEDADAGKAIVSIDSTNKNATINDKNVSKYDTEEKTVDDTSYSIGETIPYTAKFNTTNYYKRDDGSFGKVYKYVITDTLPEFLENVTVTKITIGTTEYKVDNAVPQFNANKQITIPWVNSDGDSLYDNGVQIIVEYKGTLTSTVNVNGTNKNTITIQGFDKSNEPFTEPFGKSAIVTTYAAAILKVDQNGDPLPGAKFKVYGLTVTGSAGLYTVTSYDSTSTTLGTEMECDENGKLYIIGLKGDTTFTAKETEAPDGYNRTEADLTFEAEVLEVEVYTESGTRYYDADGNLVNTESSSTTNKQVEKNLDELDENALEVENNAGTELPSTGGIGTTLFYVIGTILVLGAGVVLVTKRRVQE